ncbi:uncharacterized protein LOC135713344 [Ochlerotatus camptorhynchus]|uniref:uncharacterized protein LOC135713344 n=1 Tax=Ochlerotatus camptorhynchus TaxID=644619 RepID=UPI0031DDC395
MNWTPGKIVGTVKPAGANVAAIPALVLTPVPAPSYSLIQQTSLATVVPVPVPAPVPITGSTSRVASSSSSIAKSTSSSVGKLQGTVQSQPSGANKILGTIKVAGSDQPGVSSDQLTNQAIEEIYRDVKIGRIRASQVGALGWRGCPLKKANKRFLHRTMRSVMTHNRRETIRTFHSSTHKLIEMDQQQHQHHGDFRHRHRKRSRHEDKEEEEEVVEVEDDEDQDAEIDVIGARKASAGVVRDADEEIEEGEIRSDDED